MSFVSGSGASQSVQFRACSVGPTLDPDLGLTLRVRQGRRQVLDGRTHGVVRSGNDAVAVKGLPVLPGGEARADLGVQHQQVGAQGDDAQGLLGGELGVAVTDVLRLLGAASAGRNEGELAGPVVQLVDEEDIARAAVVDRDEVDLVRGQVKPVEEQV